MKTTKKAFVAFIVVVSMVIATVPMAIPALADKGSCSKALEKTDDKILFIDTVLHDILFLIKNKNYLVIKL